MRVVMADALHAPLVHQVIQAAFGDRPLLDPPSDQLAETQESVAAALAEHGGLLVFDDDDQPVGALLFDACDELLGLRRVGVIPTARRMGVAHLLAKRAAEIAAERDCLGLRLQARAELPATVRFWTNHGYHQVGRTGPCLEMLRLLPIHVELPDRAATINLGERIAQLLRHGDVVILAGDLGAGKTTLTQGIGAGLGVRGPITSPTYVISRVHPSLRQGPALVHVDAYRLHDGADLDSLDLDTAQAEVVTVVEWGQGVAENLAEDYLLIQLDDLTPTTAAVLGDDELAASPRRATITAVGQRWLDDDIASVVQ